MGTKTVLRDTNTVLWETKTVLRDTKTLLRDTKTLLRGTKTVLWDTKTLLRDNEYVLRDTKYVHRNLNKHSLLGTYDQPSKQTSLVQCVKSSLQGFVKAMPSSEYNNIITNCDVVNDNECINQVDIVNQCMIPRCVERHRHSGLRPRVMTRRVRDREPSRISFKRKPIYLLKRRKFRNKHHKMLQKSVPVSSVVYSNAANYKQLNITFTDKTVSTVIIS